MTLSAENLLTLAIVTLAVGYLTRRAWTVIAGKRQGGCGRCAQCPGSATNAEPQVLSVESLLEPVRKSAN